MHQASQAVAIRYFGHPVTKLWIEQVNGGWVGGIDWEYDTRLVEPETRFTITAAPVALFAAMGFNPEQGRTDYRLDQPGGYLGGNLVAMARIVCARWPGRFLAKYVELLGETLALFAQQRILAATFELGEALATWHTIPGAEAANIIDAHLHDHRAPP